MHHHCPKDNLHNKSHYTHKLQELMTQMIIPYTTYVIGVEHENKPHHKTTHHRCPKDNLNNKFMSCTHVCTCDTDGSTYTIYVTDVERRNPRLVKCNNEYIQIYLNNLLYL